MAITQLATALICSMILLPLVAANDAYSSPGQRRIPRKVRVVVEGMVYCQNCRYFGSWSLTQAQPMASAKVSVTCKNRMNQVGYYKAYETDHKGYFFAQLDGFKMRNSIVEHPLQACTVKLLSSPLANCSLLSNINNGLSGAPLTYVKELRGPHYEAALYKAGPLAFRPNNCPVKPTY